MEVVHNLTGVKRGVPSAVTIGNFDGFHLGHQRLVSSLVESARDEEVQSVVITFREHPLRVLEPGRVPLPLTSLRQKLELLDRCGVDLCLAMDFDLFLAGQEPEEFVRKILVECLGARKVVVGYNYAFGRGRKGKVPTLEELGKKYGFSLEVVPPVKVKRRVVSSTDIREQLLRGELEEATLLLGRPYALAGEVIQGHGRGRSLGYPTANLAPETPPLVSPGVYAGLAYLGESSYQALLYYGRQLTFGGKDTERLVEVYLLDFGKDIYGQRLRFAFLHRLRPEKAFPEAAALARQIKEDVNKTKSLLARTAEEKGDKPVVCLEQGVRCEGR